MDHVMYEYATMTDRLALLTSLVAARARVGATCSCDEAWGYRIQMTLPCHVLLAWLLYTQDCRR